MLPGGAEGQYGLFDPAAPGSAGPLSPRSVQCPTCGALEGHRCRIRNRSWWEPPGSRPESIYHPTRVALMRHVAGIADEELPVLF